MFFIFTNLVCVYGNIKTIPPGNSPEPITDAWLEPVPTVREHSLPVSSFHGGSPFLCIMHQTGVLCKHSLQDPITLMQVWIWGIWDGEHVLAFSNRRGMFYLIFSESQLKLNGPLLVNLLLFYDTLLFHSCHCVLLEIVSCWQALS